MLKTSNLNATTAFPDVYAADPNQQGTSTSTARQRQGEGDSAAADASTSSRQSPPRTVPNPQPKPPPTFKAHSKAAGGGTHADASSNGMQSAMSFVGHSPHGKQRLPPLQHPASQQPAALAEVAGGEAAAGGLSGQQSSQQAGLNNPVSSVGSGEGSHELPIPETSYQTAHHAFIPKNRRPSAWVRKVKATHPSPVKGEQAAGGGDGRSSGHKSGAAALLRSAGLRSDDTESDRILSGPAGEWGAGVGTWGGTSSVGDLEALDSILDQLVVLDPRMREALLRGPLISFETVVPEARAALGLVTEFPAEDTRDHTFLTSVKGVVQEEEEEGGEEQGPAAGNQAEAVASNHTAHHQHQQQQVHAGVVDDLPHSMPSRTSFAPHNTVHHLQQHHQQQHHDQQQELLAQQEREFEALRNSIPVPILPKLARMYITSKQTGAAKVAPPPPPTAEWLLRSRPPPTQAAVPSYDDLCSQIRDVQRQYTCGTARERIMAGGGPEPGRPPRIAARSALDVYISGLDGPTLDEVVAPQDHLLSSLERSRPSFVSMQRAKRPASRTRSGRKAGSRGASPGGRAAFVAEGHGGGGGNDSS